MPVPPMDPIDIAIGARVRALRVFRGLAQQDLAEAAGVTFQQIQKYERGRNRISASMLARIASVLRVSMIEIFAEGEAADRLDKAAEILAAPGAVELLRAYRDLPQGKLREHLVGLAKAAGEHHRAAAGGRGAGRP